MSLYRSHPCAVSRRPRPDWANWVAPEHKFIAQSMDRDDKGNLILDPRPNIMVPPRPTYTIEQFNSLNSSK